MGAIARHRKEILPEMPCLTPMAAGTAPQHGPLDGVKVVDFSRAMAGPFCTMLLGDLGADVIKVEPQKGDDTRSWSPPEMNGVSAYFMSANRNKKSIVLDLKHERSAEIVARMAAEADVVVENFRPGVADRLGIGYATMSAANRRLVYCSISGFGQTGPYRERAGFDLTVLAVSGLMSLTGEEGRPPVKFGVPITDINAGLFSAVAILSALYRREIDGEGQYIDMSMLDASLLTLTHQATSYFATGKNPKRLGSAHSSIAPYQVYATADGFVSVAVGSEKLWKDFCTALGMDELMADGRLGTNPLRVKNRDYLNARLDVRFLGLTTGEAVRLLEGAGIPVAPINSVGEALSDPQVRARGMVKDVNHPVYGEVKSIGSPFTMSRTPGSVRLGAPLLGEHTGEILASLGYSGEEIEEMVAKGAAFRSGQ